MEELPREPVNRKVFPGYCSTVAMIKLEGRQWIPALFWIRTIFANIAFSHYQYFNAVNITPFPYFSIRQADYSGMISSIRRNIFSENDRFFLIK